VPQNPLLGLVAPTKFNKDKNREHTKEYSPKAYVFLRDYLVLFIIIWYVDGVQISTTHTVAHLVLVVCVGDVEYANTTPTTAADF